MKVVGVGVSVYEICEGWGLVYMKFVRGGG